MAVYDGCDCRPHSTVQPFMVVEYLWDIMREEAMGYLNGKQSLAESVEGIAGNVTVSVKTQVHVVMRNEVRGNRGGAWDGYEDY